jgi:protein gp37
MKAIIEDICAVGNCMPPSNLWLGVSVENQATADERIPLLLQTPVALRWISYEPALGPLDLRAIEQADDEDGSGALFFPLDGEFTCEGRNEPAPIKSGGIRWVVCGGESGPQARPMHPDWARAVRDQCQAAGVPFFFKQWGEWEPSLKFLEQFKDVSPKTPVLRLSSDAHIGHNLAEMEGHPRQGLMVKTGKKRAGRLLDGREWNEYPEVHA